MNINCLIAHIEDATPTNFSKGELRLRDALHYRNKRRRAIVPTLATSALVLLTVVLVLVVMR